MRERVEGLVGTGAAGGMWVLTFHSICARLLRREHADLGVPSSFTIFDDGDTERLVSAIAATSISTRSASAQALAAAISHAKNVSSAPTSSPGWHRLLDEIVAKVYGHTRRASTRPAPSTSTT